MNSPIIPGQSARGTNAATVVAVDDIIGHATSPTPSVTDTYAEFPSSIYLYMFSTMTIPLSTSIPSARTNENSTITFRVMPMEFNIRKDISIDIGMAIPTNNAFRNPRKNSKTPTTRMIPKMIEFSRLDTISRVTLDWSLVRLTSTLLGMVPSFFAFSMISLIFVEATSKFSPPCFLISSITTDVPNSLAKEMVSEFPKNTSEMSSR